MKYYNLVTNSKPRSSSQILASFILLSLTFSNIFVQADESNSVNIIKTESLIKRSSFIVEPNELVPHPLISDLKMLPMIYPENSVSISNDTVDLDKRYIWWVIGAIWKTAETGIAIKGLVSDCQDWSTGGKWGKFSCVYGAISTLATVAGAGWAGYQYGSGIWRALNNILQYRDLVETSQHHIIGQLTDYQHATVNHTKLPWSPIFDDQGYLLVDTRAEEHVPIFFGYDFNGIPAHMSYSYQQSDDGNHVVFMNFRHQPKSSNSSDSNFSKREQFNEQDFSSGGLEAGFSYNQNNDGGWLDPSNDYGQMDHEVSCNFANLDYNGLEFQIYDNNHHGTIAAGNIRACQGGAYDADSLRQIQTPLPINQNCAVA